MTVVVNKKITFQRHVEMRVHERFIIFIQMVIWSFKEFSCAKFKQEEWLGSDNFVQWTYICMAYYIIRLLLAIASLAGKYFCLCSIWWGVGGNPRIHVQLQIFFFSLQMLSHTKQAKLGCKCIVLIGSSAKQEKHLIGLLQFVLCLLLPDARASYLWW